MICKLNFGSGFQGCLDYITGKYDQDKHTKILAHSSGIPDMDNRTVAQIFDAYAEKGGHDIGKPVGHFAYSFHPDEAARISDDFMMKIVREHMELLGIRNAEWIFGRHYDTNHEHGHLMFSMVDRDGNVISDSMIFERNKRICKYLTKKYGLMMSSDKEKVNRDKLRGKEKLKYEFYDKVMKCKLMSSTWQEFDKALKAEGMKLRFHYNNVTGKLMGVAFSDGKVSFSGNKLDPELKLDSLIKEFGDLKQIAHDSVHDWYEDYQMRLRYINDWNGFRNLMKAHPEWKDIFPDKEIPSFKYLSIPNLLDRYVEEDQEYFSLEYTPSDDVIRAALRKDNLNHEAEIQMLIAICEKYGIIVKRDEKTCEISIEFSKDAPKSFSQQASSAPPAPTTSAANIHLDARKIGEILAPIIRNQIDTSIDAKDITATAYVDSSILVRNNKDVFDVITQEWRDWAEQQHNAVPASSKGKNPVIAFGGDFCYKVEDEAEPSVVPNRHVGTTEKGKSSKFRIFFSHVWDDIVTSWWKCAAYIIAMCCIVFAVASWYKSYRLEQVAKEYYIIKPLLRDDRKFGPFIHSLDSAILSSGVDDVCEKIYGRPEKKE